MASEMRLTYFNSRGRAELTRLMFKLAGKEFVDRRVERGEEWDTLKPTTPKGELPILEVDGKVICESMAIAKFVAREFSLYGANNWEAATCDMVLDSNLTIFAAVLDYVFKAKTDEEKAGVMEKIQAATKTLDQFLNKIKKGTFVLGDKASIADASMQNLMEVCATFPGFDADSYPTVRGIVKSFEEIPAIAEWIKSRPETKM